MRKYINLISFFWLVLAVIVVEGAEDVSVERADQKDIEMLLGAASGVNSAYWASYIGETRSRIYIEYETAVHAGSSFSKELKRVIYWFPRSEIADEQLDRFKAYKNKYESRQ